MRHRAELPAHRFVPVGADEATVLPAARAAILERGRRAAGPVQPGGEHRGAPGVPGMREALRGTAARVVGLSPIIGGRAVRGMADACLTALGVETTAEARRPPLRRPGRGRLLDGWLVHTGDPADVPGAEVRSVPLLMTDVDATAAMARAALDLAGAPSPEGHSTSADGSGPIGTTARPAASRSCPSRAARVPPGDDLAAALAAAAPWLADGDVVVVTTKIVSKVEGRLVAAPVDPEARDARAPRAGRRRDRAGARAAREDADRREQARDRAGRRGRRRLERAAATSWPCCRRTPTRAPHGCGPR